MRIAKLIALLSTLLVVMSVSARMYEWVNPATGRVQLSGNPPTWYRGTAAGPRVRVFENGALVDDTSIRLSAEDNGALREVAMAKVEERRQLDALRQLEIATQRETAMQTARAEEAERLATAEERRRTRDGEVAPAQTEASVDETVASTEVPEIPLELDARTIERLKALISDFDRVQ